MRTNLKRHNRVYILASKHTYRPIRARIVAPLFYKIYWNMKRPGVFLFPLDGVLVRRYPFIHLGEERHCESKVSCPRTQHNVPGQGSNPDRSICQRVH